MKALRYHGQKDIRLEQVEIPTCGKNHVKVQGDGCHIFVVSVSEHVSSRSSRPFVAFAGQVTLLDGLLGIACRC